MKQLLLILVLLLSSCAPSITTNIWERWEVIEIQNNIKKKTSKLTLSRIGTNDALKIVVPSTGLKISDYVLFTESVELW